MSSSLLRGRTGFCPSKVMSVARLPAEDSNSEPKGARIEIQPVLGFSDKDIIGTIQPHDDALVVTLRIWGYDVKRVLVNQGNVVKIMYPNLYKGLNLKPKPLLLIPSRPGTHYEEMQEFMGPFGTAGPRRKVKVAVAPF